MVSCIITKYCGTPPEHMLFGQAKAFRDDTRTKVLRQFGNAIGILAGMVRAAVGKWAEGWGVVNFNITRDD